MKRCTQKRIHTLIWKVDRIADKFRVDTQKIRERLVLQLQGLFDMANQQAQECSAKDWKQKQAWARIAAYISQVINSVGNTYDLNVIEEQVTALKKQMEDTNIDLAKLLSTIKTKETQQPQEQSQ